MHLLVLQSALLLASFQLGVPFGWSLLPPILMVLKGNSAPSWSVSLGFSCYLGFFICHSMPHIYIATIATMLLLGPSSLLLLLAPTLLLLGQQPSGVFFGLAASLMALYCNASSWSSLVGALIYVLLLYMTLFPKYRDTRDGKREVGKGEATMALGLESCFLYLLVTGDATLYPLLSIPLILSSAKWKPPVHCLAILIVIYFYLTNNGM
jgi:hypothetical protein